MPEGGVMAGDCGVTGAGVCGRAGATAAGVPGVAADAATPAAAGAVFTGMNSGPFWPQPHSAGTSTATDSSTDSPTDGAKGADGAGGADGSLSAPQITADRYDANISFTIRITV